MNQKILEKVQMNIRKNFGKEITYQNNNPFTMNCFMYAVFCNQPIEICKEIISGIPDLYSFDGKAYFSTIGGFSNSKFNTLIGLKRALTKDLDVLGLNSEWVSKDYKLKENEFKIAFYYDTKNNNFHFFRQESDGKWSEKAGWKGDIYKFSMLVAYNNMGLIGFKKISLKK